MNAKNIFGAITVAIALFFVWPGVFNSWAQMRALKAAVAERELIVAERDLILKNASDEYAKYQKIVQGTSAATFTSLVPAKKDAAELVSAVGAIATNSGLQLTKILVGESAVVQADSQFATMTLTMDLSGQYTGLGAFLKDLETYVRVLNISKIEISTSESGTLGYIIRADTYYIK